MRQLLYLSLCVILLAACSPRNSPAPTSTIPTDLEITLSRSRCLGACPVYTLTITGDGKVIYNGEANVALRGEVTSSIDQSRIQQLIAAFQAAEYFSLKDKYEGQISDVPTVITSIRFGERYKRISNYGDCMESVEGTAPKQLCDLENQIDELSGANNWIGK